MLCPNIQILSGGQTGVDRAALDAALAAGVPVDGWCPSGRVAEDGAIPDRYPLRETPSAKYAQRTARNVRDADATLILSEAPLQGGTRLTAQLAHDLGRPLLVVAPCPEAVRDTIRWLRRHRIRVLNVAGPRESEAPGIYSAARRFMSRVFRALGEGACTS